MNQILETKKKLNKILKDNNISGIMHFAGLKSVERSNSERKEYFDVNVNGTRNLINTLNETNNNKSFLFLVAALAFMEAHIIYLMTRIIVLVQKTIMGRLNLNLN